MGKKEKSILCHTASQTTCVKNTVNIETILHTPLNTNNKIDHYCYNYYEYINYLGSIFVALPSVENINASN